MLFSSWAQLGEVAAKGAITYLAVIIALRFFGMQALAQMSAYDLICTIALGSFVANLAFARDLSLASGLAGVIAVLVLQELMRYLIFRVRRVRKLVAEQPCVVVWRGAVLKDRLASFHIAMEEVRAAVRRAGLASFEEAQAVVLENDGNWSVVPRRESSDLSAFDGLDCPDR
ncbi:MAG: DUF421 domain-containing protein [Deltaproteobacteria bacterium]|nr:DUF421 domain-containing protein [Deltaproteobacteria bacterium]